MRYKFLQFLLIIISAYFLFLSELKAAENENNIGEKAKNVLENSEKNIGTGLVNPDGTLNLEETDGDGKKIKNYEKNSGNIGSVLVSLVLWFTVVVLIIFALFYIVKKFFPGSRKLFSSNLVNIIGRTYLSPKHTVYLLKVGERIIVVGVSGDRMETLSEISDKEEVKILTGKGLQESKDGKPSFFNMFSKKSSEFKQDERTLKNEDEMENTKNEIERLRLLVGNVKNKLGD